MNRKRGFGPSSTTIINSVPLNAVTCAAYPRQENRVLVPRTQFYGSRLLVPRRLEPGISARGAAGPQSLDHWASDPDNISAAWGRRASNIEPRSSNRWPTVLLRPFSSKSGPWHPSNKCMCLVERCLTKKKDAPPRA